MAVTKIWAIRGRINHVLNYAANEEKTLNPEFNSEQEEYSDKDVQGLYDVMNYAMNDAKTEDRLFVSGVNCDPENARAEMIRTKERAGKMDGIVAYHMYQSFRPGETTPEIAHKIGIRLAEELLGSRFEAVVATHLNTSCLHNHVVINSVSGIDGKKFYDQRKTVYEIRRISDRLCREFGLSVIEHPKGHGKSYVEWQAEKNGEYTKSGIIRRDIDECLAISMNEKQFYSEMQARGYTFNFDRKYPTIFHPSFPKARRMKTLGEEYTPEAIREKLRGFKIPQPITLPEQDDSEQFFFDGDRNNRDIFKDRQTIYVHFVCGIRVVRERPDENRELMRLLGDEILKFDKLIEEQNLMLDHKLFSDDDVSKYKTELLSETEYLTDARQTLRNALKRAVRSEDAQKQYELKHNIQRISERLKIVRRDITVCERILSHGQTVEQKLTSVKSQIEKSKGKEERNQYEHIGRRSGTSRQDVTGRR